MGYTTLNNTSEADSHFRQLYEEAPLPYQSLDTKGMLLEDPVLGEVVDATPEGDMGDLRLAPAKP